MATVLYIAERGDPTYQTIVVDLNALATGTVGFALLHDPDFGSLENDPTWLGQAPYPVTTLASRQHGVAYMRLRVRLVGSSSDDEIKRTRALVSELDAGGTMVFQPDGVTSPVYIRFFSSPIQALLRGQELGTYQLARLFTDQEGYPLTIPREPYMFTTEVTGITKRLTGINTSVIVTNSGNMVSPARVTVTPVKGSVTPATVQFRVARRSVGNITELQSLWTGEAESANNLYTDTALATLAGASGGASNNTLLTNFATTSANARRWRRLVKPTDRAALAGTYRVFLVGAFGAASTFKVQLRWGLASVDPVELANDPVTVDTTDSIGTPPLIAVDVGQVQVTSDVDNLVLEAWAERTAGTGSINWDWYFLMPSDELTSAVSVAGVRSGAIAGDVWKGSSLVTITGTPVVSGDTVVISVTNAEVGSPPSGGAALPQGQHTVTFNLTVQNDAKAAAQIGTVLVRNVTDATDKTTAYAARSIAGKRYSQVSIPITFNIASTETAKLMQARVKVTNGGGGKRIYVRSIEHTFVRTSSNSPFVLDGIERESVLRNTSGNRIATLVPDGGGYVDLVPGDNLLMFDFGEFITLLGWNRIVVAPGVVRSTAKTLAEFSVGERPDISYDVRVDHLPKLAPM